MARTGSFEDWLGRQLSEWTALGRLRTPRVIPDARCFCSNDYLGLAGDPGFAREVSSRIAGLPSGAGASRLIAGTLPCHAALESELAQWLGTEKTLFFANGYAANLGLLSALGTAGARFFSDALNHASIIDGIRLGRGPCDVYRHLDLQHLGELLAASSGHGGPRVVVTEAIFSMDGDVAPLEPLVALCGRHGAVLIVDEAHSLGVRGRGGRGLCDELGLAEQVDVRMGACGKAFGSVGAFVACSEPLATFLYNRARSFVFSTAPPPAVVEAVRAALPYLEAGDRQARLHERVADLSSALSRRGWWSTPAQSPIFPIGVRTPERAVALAAALLEEGFFVHPVRPPTVPEGTSRLRVTVTSEHSRDEIEAFAEGLSRAAARVGLSPDTAWGSGTA